jgi:hypothetical protein
VIRGRSSIVSRRAFASISRSITVPRSRCCRRCSCQVSTVNVSRNSVGSSSSLNSSHSDTPVRRRARPTGHMAATNAAAFDGATRHSMVTRTGPCRGAGESRGCGQCSACLTSKSRSVRGIRPPTTPDEQAERGDGEGRPQTERARDGAPDHRTERLPAHEHELVVRQRPGPGPRGQHLRGGVQGGLDGDPGEPGP